jgi:anaerobic ribonucleoside-triphosphate reductase activating protein
MADLLNLHAFVNRSRANGPGERAVVWVQGCPRRCAGCFNPETQEFVDREWLTVEELESRILAIDGIEGVTFSGGEPFEQAEALSELAKRLRKCGFTVVCYTGYTLEQLRAGNREDWNALLSEVDLLIDGPFIQSQRCHEPYRGSANQTIHFLSGRIRPEQVSEAVQTAEFTLGVDGQMMETGFPDTDEVFGELAEILNSKQSR